MGKKNFGKKIFGQKNFQVKFFFVKTYIFGSKIFFGSKKFWGKKNFGSKKFWIQARLSWATLEFQVKVRSKYFLGFLGEIITFLVWIIPFLFSKQVLVSLLKVKNILLKEVF